jgi:hypothetical protein
MGPSLWLGPRRGYGADLFLLKPMSEGPLAKLCMPPAFANAYLVAKFSYVEAKILSIFYHCCARRLAQLEKLILWVQ